MLNSDTQYLYWGWIKCFIHVKGHVFETVSLLAVLGTSEEQDNHFQDTTTLCQKAWKHEH